MPPSEASIEVLKDILSVGSERNLILGNRIRAPTPTAIDLLKFCDVLSNKPKEETLQLYIEQNIGYLTGLFGSPDNCDIAVLFKPMIGTQYKADFAVLQSHQGGCVIHMVEIEDSDSRLFTKNGTPSRRLSGALKQLEDWKICIAANPLYFSNDLLRISKLCPLYGDSRDSSRGYRFTDEDKISWIWTNFGGDQNPIFTYTVLIGRWSKLSSEDKARILNRNRESSDKIYTYEQVARTANFRLERDEWHNELDYWQTAK